MDIKKGPTALDDDAGLYQKREEKSEKQKFSELHGIEKLQYFKDYYFKLSIAAVLILALVVYLAYTIWDSKRHSNFLYAAVINYALQEDELPQLIDAFGEYAGRTSKFQTITFDTSHIISALNDGMDMQFMSNGTMDKLQVLIMAGDVDLFIAPEQWFSEYTARGIMLPLSEYLPEDLYESWEEDIFTGSIIDEVVEEEIILEPADAYGIYIENNPRLAKMMPDGQRIVLGVVASTKNKKHAVDFIRFITDEILPPE